MAYKALEIEPKVVQKVSKHEVIYESQRLVSGGGGDGSEQAANENNGSE